MQPSIQNDLSYGKLWQTKKYLSNKILIKVKLYITLFNIYKSFWSVLQVLCVIFGYFQKSYI